MRSGWTEKLYRKKKSNQSHKAYKQTNRRTSNLVILLRKRAPGNQRVHRKPVCIPSSLHYSLPPFLPSLLPSLLPSSIPSFSPSFLFSFSSFLLLVLSSSLPSFLSLLVYFSFFSPGLTPLQKCPPEIMVVAVQTSRSQTKKKSYLSGLKNWKRLLRAREYEEF